jgi:hypothetical protein
MFLSSFYNSLLFITSRGSELKLETFEKGASLHCVPLLEISFIVSRSYLALFIIIIIIIIIITSKKQSQWPKSASELYRPSDRRLSAKLVLTFADRWCHVVSVTGPYCRILGFLDR